MNRDEGTDSQPCSICNFPQIRALGRICCIESRPVSPLTRRPSGLIRKGEVFSGHGSTGEKLNDLTESSANFEPLANSVRGFRCAPSMGAFLRV